MTQRSNLYKLITTNKRAKKIISFKTLESKPIYDTKVQSLRLIATHRNKKSTKIISTSQTQASRDDEKNYQNLKKERKTNQKNQNQDEILYQKARLLHPLQQKSNQNQREEKNIEFKSIL